MANFNTSEFDDVGCTSSWKSQSCSKRVPVPSLQRYLSEYFVCDWRMDQRVYTSVDAQRSIR